METKTFKEVSEIWKRDKRQYVKPSSYSTYVLLLNKHILPVFGESTLVTESDVQSFVLKKLDEGLSTKSVKVLVLVLKMITRFGAKAGYWPVPDWSIHYPTEQVATNLDVLNRQDQKRILTHIKDHFTCRNLGIYICLSAGLRIGEVCALQWQDLDMEDEVIRIRKTLGRVYQPDGTSQRSHLVLGKPKTVNAIREVPMSREMIRLVRPLTRVANPEYFLLSNDEKPLEPKTYRNYYKRFMTDLGVADLKFHGLRHSFATRCIESGCDYKTVSVLLGHANVGTTLNLYVHPNLDQKKKCIEKVFRHLG